METNSLPMTTTVRLIGQQKSGQRATLAYDNNSNLTTKWHQGGNPQTMVYDAADRLTTMQSGGTTGTMSWFSRGAMRNQYETGTIKATYSYTDINNNLRVAQDAAGLTTSTTRQWLWGSAASERLPQRSRLLDLSPGVWRQIQQSLPW